MAINMSNLKLLDLVESLPPVLSKVSDVSWRLVSTRRGEQQIAVQELGLTIYT